VIVSGGRPAWAERRLRAAARTGPPAGRAVGRFSRPRWTAAGGLQPAGGHHRKIVSPEVDVAVAISAPAHLSGMSDSRVIVAINKDPRPTSSRYPTTAWWGSGHSAARSQYPYQRDSGG